MRVWIIICVSIVVTGLLYWFLEYLDPKADERELDSKPMTSIFYAALVFVGNFDLQPNTDAARILSWSWTFWAVIVCSAYTAYVVFCLFVLLLLFGTNLFVCWRYSNCVSLTRNHSNVTFLLFAQNKTLTVTWLRFWYHPKLMSLPLVPWKKPLIFKPMFVSKMVVS